MVINSDGSPFIFISFQLLVVKRLKIPKCSFIWRLLKRKQLFPRRLNDCDGDSEFVGLLCTNAGKLRIGELNLHDNTLCPISGPESMGYCTLGDKLTDMLDIECEDAYMKGMNKLDTKTRKLIIRCLVEGQSIRATARTADVSKKTPSASC